MTRIEKIDPETYLKEHPGKIYQLIFARSDGTTLVWTANGCENAIFNGLGNAKLIDSKNFTEEFYNAVGFFQQNDYEGKLQAIVFGNE